MMHQPPLGERHSRGVQTIGELLGFGIITTLIKVHIFVFTMRGMSMEVAVEPSKGWGFRDVGVAIELLREMIIDKNIACLAT